MRREVIAQRLFTRAQLLTEVIHCSHSREMWQIKKLRSKKGKVVRITEGKDKKGRIIYNRG